MAPARSSTRRGHIQPHALDAGSSGNHDLFIDPMLGTPLAVYIEKDVHDREALVNLITVSFASKSLTFKFLGRNKGRTIRPLRTVSHVFSVE